MALIIDIIEIVKRTYLSILKQKNLDKTKEIDIDYQEIAKEIMAVIKIAIARGSQIFEIANDIIYMLLNKNFFKHENHIAAVTVAYLYLKRGDNTISKPLSIGNINNNSTLKDIQKLTESWK